MQWRWIRWVAVALFLGSPRAGAQGEAEPYRDAMVAAVHHFAREGEVEHLKAVLDRHPDLLNAVQRFREPHKPLTSDPFTPLETAVSWDRVEAAAMLIERGADVNRAGGNHTPLHTAAIRGSLPMVKLLVEHGADVNARTPALPESVGPGNNAPTMSAGQGQRFPAVPSRTALEWAAVRGHADVVKYLKSAAPGAGKSSGKPSAKP